MAESLPSAEYGSEETLRRLRRLVDDFRQRGYGTSDHEGIDNNNDDDSLTLLQQLREMTMRMRDRSLGGAPPASRSVIDALVKESVEEGSVVECAVCMDCVGVGVLVTKLPCGHRYHGDCIVPWLQVRNSCPVCRFELETSDPQN